METDCHYCGEPVEYVDAEQRHFCSYDCQHYFYNTAWALGNGPLPPPPHETVFDVMESVAPRRPVVGAHRGGTPENTMVAFRQAVQAGAQLLELDVRLTADNHLVLMHWPVVGPRTDGYGRVSRHTLAELQELDAADEYPALRGRGITVPTLREFLDEFAPQPDLLFVLDFKDCETAEATLAFIKQYPSVGHRVILSSVLHRCNRLLREARASPAVPVLADIRDTFRVTVAYWTGRLAHFHFDHDIYGFMLRPTLKHFWCQGLVDAVHAAGARVMVCGPEMNKPERMRQAVAMGVDIILTDRPEQLAEIVCQAALK